jgi:tRNA 2-thiouridine synthesizing protein A
VTSVSTDGVDVPPGGEEVEVLDARGLNCPEPVMLLHKAMRGLPEGTLLRVLATDPTTLRDIPQFCRFLGHELLAQEETAGELVFALRKGAASG